MSRRLSGKNGALGKAQSEKERVMLFTLQGKRESSSSLAAPKF